MATARWAMTVPAAGTAAPYRGLSRVAHRVECHHHRRDRMSTMAVQPYALGQPSWMELENIILQIGDAFNIRVLWERDTALMASACALAGGLVGAYAGGRVGAAVGAGLGSVAGVGVSALVSLREVWAFIRDKLPELVFLVLNHLRRLDALDLVYAVQLLAASTSSRRELALALVEFMATKLGREVVSSLTAG